jgi:phage head maturation protease
MSKRRKNVRRNAALAAAALSIRSAAAPAPTGFKPGQQITRDARVDLQARFSVSTYNAEQHTIDVVLSTGARGPQFGGFLEELSLDPAAVDLSRVAQGVVPFLDRHDQYTIDAKLGTIVSAWIEGGQLHGRIRFDQNSERAVTAEKRIAAGELPAVSIGYHVKAWTLVGAENNTEIWRATSWVLMEASSVTVPFDAQATMRAATPNGSTPPAGISAAEAARRRLRLAELAA